MLLIPCAIAALVLPPAPPVDRVVIVSVDGLRADALEGSSLGQLPAFGRLLQGPHTLNARCDPDISVTLPNHVGMVTGRMMLGPSGHAYELNTLPLAPAAGGLVRPSPSRYIASCFDVAHDAGLSTAAIASKLKFTLFAQTWGDEYGAADADPRGGDNGRNKIDTFTFAPDMPRVTDAVIDALDTLDAPDTPDTPDTRPDDATRGLVFAHYALPDSVGHTTGWTTEPNQPWMASVKAVDDELGRLLTAIDTDPKLNGRTAIVLTADHGGGVPFGTHTDQDALVNYRIPFIVWVDGTEHSCDLYATNSGVRADPGVDRATTHERVTAPIRNTDAGNAALQLLGLEPVPGSVYGGESLPLTVTPPATPPAVTSPAPVAPRAGS